ncbi:MAG: efflux RND transporter periplasmic adaptor subunit [Oscillospiraceae bacterium]|nr:efflux RND transporter periplasmic adaptor subunit [Oscillospiraceae bacterium]
MAENEKKTSLPTGEDIAPPEVQVKKKKKKINKWVKRGIAAAVIVACVGGYVVHDKNKKAREAEAEATSNTAVVSRGDITVKITGSGTVSAIDEYNIVPTVNGEIKSDYFDEGDYVNEGDVLYRFDSTVAANAIKTAENQIKTTQNSVTRAKNAVSTAETNLQNRADDVTRAQENIEKLTIYANSTGRVSGLNLTVGNDVGGNICTITDTSTQLVKVPFNASQFPLISVGDSATLSIEKYMSTTTGTVRHKYNAARTGSDGSVVYDVEILIGGGVELPESTIVTATVHTASGDCSSSLTGSVYYPNPTTVNAEQQGKVQSIYVENGDWVRQGDIIAKLTSTNLQDALKTARQNYESAETSLQEAKNSYQDALTSLENAQTSLEDRRSDAEDYTITAPISGVVLSKSYKAGDTIYGMNSTTMMVIADMSKMKFTISVDELDITSIALGQEVEVTSDALEGVELVGRITTISQMGTSQNGVTNYPVEVTIDEPGDLMSGMNVSAEIIVAEAKNVIRVPVDAVNYFNGGYYVTVVGEVEEMTDDGRSAGSSGANRIDGEAGRRGGRPDGQSEAAEGAEAPASNDVPAVDEPSSDSDGAPADRADAMPMGGMNGAPGNRGNRSGRNSDLKINLYDEEQRVQVTVGINDDDYYEIISGLEVGQVVHSESRSVGGFFSMMMGGMGGGPGGGGGRR